MIKVGRKVLAEFPAVQVRLVCSENLEDAMPIVRISCLPQIPEEQLKKLYQDIVAAVVGIEELGLKNIDHAVTCLFPPDSMSYGLGDEVIIEVIGLFEKPERTEEVRQRLAVALKDTVDAMFPEAFVECLIYAPFRPAWGYASNRRH